MKQLLAIAMCLLANPVAAEDGLVIQLHIEEQQTGSATSTQYTNAMLMRFNEEVSAEFRSLYVIKLQAASTDAKHVDLLVTLKDIEDGKPYYVGAKALDINVGESAAFALQRDGRTYRVTLDSSYGVIPPSGSDIGVKAPAQTQ